ncbi:HAD family hydrolase [Holdemania massiliensis]|uniref:HAD family hydrolase n=1 Tax=Holdemania massiliensis TaxID=1468449 RepID=UPI0035681743
MQNIKAVLFDFDYTLGDSSSGIVISVNYALNKLAYPPAEPQVVCSTIGLSLPETFLRLTGCHDPLKTAAFAQFFKEKADEVMVAHTNLYPGVQNLLVSLRSRQICIGIVSTKYHYRINQILSHNQMTKLFDGIVGAEDVVNPKPDPQGVLKMMEQFASTPSKTLYVGDSLVDALTAQNAQSLFAAVLSGATSAEAFQVFHPLAVMSNLSEILTLLD